MTVTRVFPLSARLLDALSQEPAWCDGDNCMECGTKFGIATRKHHWSVITLGWGCRTNTIIHPFDWLKNTTYEYILYRVSWYDNAQAG